MNIRPDYIPNAVAQALAWLDKMNMIYSYIPEGKLWEFIYDGLCLYLMNDCEDSGIGLYAPIIITDTDDDETCKMVYEWSAPIMEPELTSKCDFGYVGDGFYYVAKWWYSDSKRPCLTKRVFMNMLKEFNDCRLEFQFIIQCTYEYMFNPPISVMKEILKGFEIK